MTRHRRRPRPPTGTTPQASPHHGWGLLHPPGSGSRPPGPTGLDVPEVPDVPDIPDGPDGPDGPGQHARIRLRGAGDVIVALPYHLGYQPEESLVLVCLDGRQISFVGRIDLPPEDVDAWVAVDELIPPVLRESPERALVIAFERREGQSEPLSTLVAGVLRDEDIEIVDRLVVRDGRFWSQECTGPCCPPEGELVPEHSLVPAVADYVLLGRRPATSRGALDERLRPDPGAAALLRSGLALARRHESASRGERSALGIDRSTELPGLRRSALTDWARLLDVGAPCVGADLGPDQPTAGWPDGRPAADAPGFSDHTWVALAASLRDVHLRDLVIAWLCPGTLDLALLDPELVEMAVAILPAPIPCEGADGLTWTSAHDEVTERLMRLCRHSPLELSPAPLTVLANHTWWHGDGALTRIALERALVVEPDYRLARLLERMVDLSIRPRGRVA